MVGGAMRHRLVLALLVCVSVIGLNLAPARGDQAVRLVRDVNAVGVGSNPANVTAVGGKAFFTANDGTLGTELLESDGTTGGTALVKDIRLGPGSSDPGGLTDVAGTLYFTADDKTHGDELWK